MTTKKVGEVVSPKPGIQLLKGLDSGNYYIKSLESRGVIMQISGDRSGRIIDVDNRFLLAEKTKDIVEISNG